MPFFLSYNQPEPRYFNYQNKKSRLYLCELIKAEFIPISQKKSWKGKLKTTRLMLANLFDHQSVLQCPLPHLTREVSFSSCNRKCIKNTLILPKQCFHRNFIFLKIFKHFNYETITSSKYQWNKNVFNFKSWCSKVAFDFKGHKSLSQTFQIVRTVVYEPSSTGEAIAWPDAIAMKAMAAKM